MPTNVPKCGAYKGTFIDVYKGTNKHTYIGACKGIYKGSNLHCRECTYVESMDLKLSTYVGTRVQAMYKSCLNLRQLSK